MKRTKHMTIHETNKVRIALGDDLVIVTYLEPSTRDEMDQGSIYIWYNPKDVYTTEAKLSPSASCLILL
jgi:hypothetical protein